MSSILDALRKSEAERNRGAVPELSQGPIPFIKKPITHRWIYFLIGGTLLVNGVALVFWLSQFEQDRGVLTVAANMSSSPPVNSVSMPEARVTESRATALIETNPTTMADAMSGSLESSASLPQLPPIDEERGANSKPIETAVRVQSTEVVEVDISSKNNPITEIVTAPEPAALPSAPSSQGEPQEDIPFLDAMPERFKQGIPTLTFNSHIYSRNVGASRVMINNVYLREGEYVQSMRVVQITPQGVVLEKEGELFRVSVLTNWSHQ